MSELVVRKHVTTETAHRLLDYSGKCSWVHGHSYKWEAEVCGSEHVLAENGILMDFSVLKMILQEHVHKVYDHALVLWDKDPLTACIGALIPSHDIIEAQKTPRIIINPYNPTAENMARNVGRNIEAALHGMPITLLSLTVWETENSFARYLP